MLIITPLFIGLCCSFLGTMLPGVLNGMAVKLQLTRGKTATHQFIFGAVCMVIVQAFLAVLLSRYLNKNPDFLELLKEYGIAAMFILSIYFFSKSKHKSSEQQSVKIRNNYLLGLIFACLNIFPFFLYLIITTLAIKNNLFDLVLINAFALSLGVGLGTALSLEIYRKYFRKKSESGSWILHHINSILAVITLGIGLFQLIKIIWK